MRWSDRSPAARAMIVGGGGIVAACVAIMIAVALHLIPIDVLTYVELPLLALASVGSVVGMILDRRWQVDQAVRRAREGDDDTG